MQSRAIASFAMSRLYLNTYKTYQLPISHVKLTALTIELTALNSIVNSCTSKGDVCIV